MINSPDDQYVKIFVQLKLFNGSSYFMMNNFIVVKDSNQITNFYVQIIHNELNAVKGGEESSDMMIFLK